MTNWIKILQQTLIREQEMLLFFSDAPTSAIFKQIEYQVARTQAVIKELNGNQFNGLLD